MALRIDLAQQAWLVERNGRAVRFARFNAILNQLDDRVVIKVKASCELATVQLFSRIACDCG